MATTTPKPQIAARLEDLIPDDAEVAAGLETLGGQIAERRGWLEAWIAAWNARDVDAILALVHDDITYDDITTVFSGDLHGKAQFRAYIEMVYRAFPDLLFVPSDWPPLFSLDGRHAAAPCRAITTFTGDMRGGTSPLALAPTDRALDVFCLDLYEFRDGLLYRWTALNKELEFMRQVGLVPEGRLLQALVRFQRMVSPLLRRFA
jgi:hypothetical protein